MKKLTFVTALALITTGSAGFAAQQRASIAVSDLTCPSCSYIVGQAMTSVSGVKIVDFIQSDTFGEATYVVSYDDATATPTAIVDAVLGYGYPAKIVETPQS